MNLNDVFPDGLMGEGIFYALNVHNVPWKNSISSVALDLEYYGNVSGGKTISPLLRRLLVDDVIPQSAITRLANSLYSMNALRWSKLWDTYQLEYNPIENYNMTEIMSDDDTVTTYGRTHSKTGTEVDDRTRTDDNKESVYGFNSNTASDSDESDRTINDDNTHTYNVSDTDTGTDRQSHSYELTRSGNIGVTTSQQMIESERSLWMWKYFYDVVFPDVDKMLTISVYSDDVIPIVSGGITPTGELSITLNGTYDVTEYASAAVEVPNTYTESDNGMVVYNGELVSQIGREISVNGTYDTTLNNAISVSVPNTYTAADEGKVVNNGALVAQGSQTITQNGTYDTTLISELIANVSGVDILGGITEPLNSEGSDGDIYIKYTDYDNLLPGYTVLESIGVESAGAYIDTGVANTATAYFEVDCKWTTAPANNSGIFGAQTTYEYAINAWQGTAFISAGIHVNISTPLTRHVLKVDASGIYIDSVNSGVVPIWSNATGRNYYILANNYSADVLKASNAVVYSVKLWNGDTLVRDFIPVKRNADDELGLYDKVTSTFYANDGTGAFIAGAELTGTPIDSAYLKVNGSWVILEDCEWSDII